MHLAPALRRVVGLWMGVVTLNAPAQSGPAPDSGFFRQQIDLQRKLPLPLPAAPANSAPVPGIREQTELNATLREFRFSGRSLVPQDRLQEAVAGFLGRPLEFDDLQKIALAVASAYRQAGWMARVYLPEQDISDGVLTLHIVEARYAGYRFEGEAPLNVRATEIGAYINARQVEGQALRSHALDRALLLADDLPGVSVAGTLVPGEAEGDIALVLQTSNEAPISLDLGLDNIGTRSLGRERITANVSLKSPGGAGELVSLNLIRTQGSSYGRFAVTLPVNHDGLRLSLSASEMNYGVIQGLSAKTAAQIRGKSGSLGAELSYPITRSQRQNLYLTAGLEHKTFFTQDTEVSSDYESQTARIGMSGNRSERRGGITSGSVQMTWGHLAAMQAHSQLQTIPREYFKVNYSISAHQPVNTRHSLVLSLSGQHASRVLDSSEKFYIGGADSVRAYPSSEQGAERGQVFSAEWRWRINSAWNASAFADLGSVDPLSTTSSAGGGTVTLRGAGLSLGWRHADGWSSKFTWSRRLGNNPRPTSSGTDGDGSLILNRVWFTASRPF